MSVYLAVTGGRSKFLVKFGSYVEVRSESFKLDWRDRHLVLE